MKSYSEFVTAGKKIVAKLDELKELEKCYQSKIAKYAVTVCEIRHGGISTDIYTMKDYALAIGMNHKTLQNWVGIYRHVLEKIGIEDPTPEEWKKASRVNNLLKIDRNIDNKNSGKRGTRGSYKKKIPKERVQEIYNDIDEKPIIRDYKNLEGVAKNIQHMLLKNAENLDSVNEYEMDRAETGAKHIEQTLSQRELAEAGEMRLLHLMQLLDRASEIINEYLTGKAKRKRA